MDAGFGDGDGLLFHCFVDCDLVGNVHFVEFVDRTDTAAVLAGLVSISLNKVLGVTYSQHEGTGFDGEFSSFGILHDRCG